jgi:2-polyprenyl-3-methyl-5-hydroxy-6-metoxy-1,4-benzoquinol methylase
MTDASLSAHNTRDLLSVQYRDGKNLSARIELHARFGTAEISWPDWVFERLELKPRDRVLEVGCGTGALWHASNRPLPDGSRLALTDVSMGMVRRARSSLADRNSAACYAAMNVEDVAFADGTFDVVVANHMLYHVPDRDRAIGELRRVLAAGGRMAAATNGGTHMEELAALAKLHYPEFNLGENASRFSRENGGAMLGRYFARVEWAQYEDSLLVSDAEAVVAYVLSVIPAAAVDADHTASLRSDVERVIAKEGAFRMRKDTGIFVART